MKYYRRFLVLAVAAAAVLLIVISRYGGISDDHERDMVMMNHIVQTVKEHISDPESLNGMELDSELVVFSESGDRIYATDNVPGSVHTAADAGREGYFCMAVIDNGRFLGTAAVPDPVLEEYNAKKNSLIITAVMIFSLIMVLLIAAGIFIRIRIIVPFRRMEKFADSIAQGNLDDPLLMEKHNMFGSFTESFDLMREELKAARSREDEMKLREKELTASLSHDIKTPVTGIKLICELLMCKTDDPYLTEKISNINQKAEQIHILAEDMLTSTLDELGEMRVNCRDESSAVIHGLVTEHDTKMLVHEGAVPECLIRIDRGRLSQVIANIISNSYKYAGTEIDVSYGFRDSFLAMTLSDHGGGVPEDEVDLLTVKYYRGKSNSDGKEGSGLGLYISGELMKRMNGDLSCTKTENGLAVTLLIPLS